MEHLSQSETIREIELQAEADCCANNLRLLRNIFTNYVKFNRPNKPGFVFIPSHCDVYSGFECDSEQVAGFNWIKNYNHAEEYGVNFRLTASQVQDIITFWHNKTPDLKLTRETIELRTAKVLWWGNKPFTIKVWKISWQ